MSFASANDIEEGDLQSLDYGFSSLNTASTPYSSTVQTIFSRHTTDIRGASEPIIAPLHLVAKKRIRDMITKQNNELFKFMQHPERTPNALGLAESIFRKYGHEVSTQRVYPISRELHLDISMNATLRSLETSISKACREQIIDLTVPGQITMTAMDASSVTASASTVAVSITANASATATASITANAVISPEFSIQTIIQQLKCVYSHYKNAGDEVMRLEALLAQKTDILDKLQQRVPLITNLTTNESLVPLLEAFEAYMKQVFASTKIEDTYNELVAAYKKWYILREVVSVQLLSNTQATEPLCSICLVDPISHTVAPCGHTFCTSCIRRMTMSCYLCRGNVRERIKLFFT